VTRVRCAEWAAAAARRFLGKVGELGDAWGRDEGARGREEAETGKK